MEDAQKQPIANKGATAAPLACSFRKGPFDDCEDVLELFKELGPSIENGLIGDNDGKGIAMILDENLYDLVEAVKENTQSRSDNADKIVAAIDRLAAAVSGKLLEVTCREAA
jgi:hypothetical protein